MTPQVEMKTHSNSITSETNKNFYFLQNMNQIILHYASNPEFLWDVDIMGPTLVKKSAQLVVKQSQKEALSSIGLPTKRAERNSLHEQLLSSLNFLFLIPLLSLSVEL